MSSTTTKRARPVKKPDPETEAVSPEVPQEGDVEALGPPATPDLGEWASGDDLDVPPYQDIVLPVLKKKVRVRPLDEPEVAALQFLPDLVGMTKLLQEMAGQTDESDEDENPDASKFLSKVDDATFARENAIYMAAVAHVSVMDPTNDAVKVECKDCKRAHAPSLWTLAQTKRLKQMDVGSIVDVALQAGLARVVRPFFMAETPDATSIPPDSGVSTPEPS